MQLQKYPCIQGMDVPGICSCLVELVCCVFVSRVHNAATARLHYTSHNFRKLSPLVQSKFAASAWSVDKADQSSSFCLAVQDVHACPALSYCWLSPREGGLKIVTWWLFYWHMLLPIIEIFLGICRFKLMLNPSSSWRLSLSGSCSCNPKWHHLDATV